MKAWIILKNIEKLLKNIEIEWVVYFYKGLQKFINQFLTFSG